MARSPLTLAASLTAAVPGADVTGVAALTSGGAGRCDSAVVTVSDGTTFVVRAPVDATAARELAVESLALRALTPGVRGLLGFRAPELRGEVGLGEERALVTDLIPGYQIDAPHVPAGEGAATSIGRALAAIHALPHSVVRAEGLPVRTPAEARDDVRALIDRAGATGRVPVRLTVRWREAVEDADIWRFESTVVLGGASAGSFLFEDSDRGPAVVGVLEWHGLAVGDPAIDMRWLASAPEAAADVYGAYADAAHRAPDENLQTRARLYAELEFARWLVHGHESHRADVVDDAAALLDSLAEGVRHGDLVGRTDAGGGVDDAIALLDRVPESGTAPVDTSMQTDAYDPEMTSLFAEAERDGADPLPADDPARSDESGEAGSAPASESFDDASTAPIDISSWIDARVGRDDAYPAEEPTDSSAEEREAERAARAAIHRWASSGSE